MFRNSKNSSLGALSPDPSLFVLWKWKGIERIHESVIRTSQISWARESWIRKSVTRWIRVSVHLGSVSIAGALLSVLIGNASILRNLTSWKNTCNNITKHHTCVNPWSFHSMSLWICSSAITACRNSRLRSSGIQDFQNSGIPKPRNCFGTAK